MYSNAWDFQSTQTLSGKSIPTTPILNSKDWDPLACVTLSPSISVVWKSNNQSSSSNIRLKTSFSDVLGNEQYEPSSLTRMMDPILLGSNLLMDDELSNFAHANPIMKETESSPDTWRMGGVVKIL